MLTFVLSSMIGGVVATALVVTRRADMATRAAVRDVAGGRRALVASLYGERIVDWYLVDDVTVR